MSAAADPAVEIQRSIHRFILHPFRHFPDTFPGDFSGKQIETQSLFCPEAADSDATSLIK